MKKKYAVVGTGGRAGLYLESIARDYQDQGHFVAFCDTNQTRMDYANQIVHKFGHNNVATYHADQFEQMIAETTPDVVIVASIDRTHHHYIIRAMELGVMSSVKNR